jgi:hypothetical protein
MTTAKNSYLNAPPPTALWQKTLILGTLAFWLSSTLLMDTVMMPVLYASGMLQSQGFAPVGYALFWVLNRVELICAGGVLVGVLAVRSLESWRTRISPRVVILAALLVSVVLAETFGLSPQMSALGVSLDPFTPSMEPPAGMGLLHVSYWLLDGLKLLAGAGILQGVYRSVRSN